MYIIFIYGYVYQIMSITSKFYLWVTIGKYI